MRRYLKKTEAFTLIEIMVVIMVIGVLAGIMVPAYQKSIEKARMAEAYSVLKAIQDAQIRYAARNAAYASSGTDLDDITTSLTTDKYFTITVRQGNPSAVDTTDSILSKAVRNTVAGGIFKAGYTIEITETGKISSPNTEVPSL